LPVKNAQLKTSSAILAYARVLDLGGVSGKFDAIVPYTALSGTAEVSGNPAERKVDGFADPRFRLSVNFCGAPAMTLKEFKDYEQDLIVGANLQVSVPSGQYDDSRVLVYRQVLTATDHEHAQPYNPACHPFDGSPLQHGHSVKSLTATLAPGRRASGRRHGAVVGVEVFIEEM
jgi:hypothetical protein